MEKEEYQEEFFFERIKTMEDRDLLISYKNRADYNSSFVRLAEEEIVIRGYILGEVDDEDIDSLVLRKKETNELVEIYTNGANYIKGWEKLAGMELESRGYDLTSLYAVNTRNKRVLKSGIQGKYIGLGYFFSFLGGFVGLAFGFNYAFSKQNTVSGIAFPKYNRATRSHGRAMLILAGVSIIIQIIIRIKTN
jgi:hypothetical protein